MNNLLQKQLRKYYRDIRKHLSGKITNKRTFLNSLKLNIENYVIENSATDITEIQEQFGTPEEIAEAYLGELSSLKLTRNIRQLKIFRLSSIIIILAMITYFFYCIFT